MTAELQLPVLIFCGTTAPIDQPLTHSIPLGRTVGNELHPQLYCDFVHDEEGVWIVPLEAILVNDQKINEPLLLSHCDKIKLTTDPSICYKFKIPICAIK